MDFAVSRRAGRPTRPHRSVAGVSYFTPLTPEQTQVAEAARTHAHNQRETIVSGIDSLGQLVYLAGDNDAGLDPHHLRNIGLLICDLAVQLEHLSDVSSSMENYLNRYLLPPVISRSSRSSSQPCRGRNTWWSTLRGLIFFFPIFIRCQSITHDSFTRSISDHGVSVSSLVRTNVIIIRRNMTLVGTNMRPSILWNARRKSGRSSGVMAAW